MSEDAAKTEETKEKRGFTARDFAEILLYVSLVVLISILIVTFVGQRTIVDRNSQSHPQNGDNLIVDKLSYPLEIPSALILLCSHIIRENTNFIKPDHRLREAVQIVSQRISHIGGEIFRGCRLGTVSPGS